MIRHERQVYGSEFTTSTDSFGTQRKSVLNFSLPQSNHSRLSFNLEKAVVHALVLAGILFLDNNSQKHKKHEQIQIHVRIYCVTRQVS